jgi:ABC-2 type transport system ATP-binding protein
MSILVSHLSKAYGKQLALNEVSFQVNSGEIVGLIGPNGAGKSTLMKIICSLLIPASGDVFVNEISVLKNAQEIKKHLGYLPENNPLYPELYVKEYLQYVAGLYSLGRDSGQRVKAVIERTGLGDEAHKKIGLLSKGYKQRVGLAQAIIHNPDVLILDEPTTGLDPNQIVQIRDLISELGKEKTVILSTHIMAEVEAICKRVIIINKGTIVADDLTGKLASYAVKGNSHTIVVEFSTETEESFFKRIPGIMAVKKLNHTTWLLETNEDADIRSSLFTNAVESGLIILSMHRKDKKLEDVFRDLTT